MILSDNHLTVPGKKYKVRVKCVSTRRLTTIEWLILSCTKRFERLPSMSVKTLKYAFEEVFQFQNSELLIKPCLRSLRNLKVIQISGGDSFDYNTLKFSDIELTDLGIIMLKDGLLPGESREIPLDIYYNPLTGKISSYNNSVVSSKDAIEFGTESDYSSEFPEETIIAELQSGSIGSGRFTASKFRIEEIDSLYSSDWDSTIAISVDANEKNVITTMPAIIADGVKDKVQDLLTTREINRVITDSLPLSEELRIKNVIGSGKSLKSAFLNVCKNGRVLFAEARFYNMFKRNTSAFKDKTLVLFGSKEDLTVENDKLLIVQIPDQFTINGCVVLNDKGEHICFCKKEYMYEDVPVIAPLAVEDERLSGDTAAAPNWLERVAFDHLLDDAGYAALFTYPILIRSMSKVKKALIDKWSTEEPAAVFEEIKRIQTVCDQLGTEMLDIGDYVNLLIKKIDYSDNKKALDTIGTILSSGALKAGSNLYRKVVGQIIEKIQEPSSYIELLGILRLLGISSHDDALLYDEYVDNLYSKAVVKDILVAIANGSYTKLPEFFELDVFFNDYNECIAQIENHVSGLKLFEIKEDNDILKSVMACPDLAALQSFVAELKAKNTALMAKGINVYDVLRNDNDAKAEAFANNLNAVEEALSIVLDEAYKEQETAAPSDDGKTIEDEQKPKKKIYIVDTCAMMHHPELFLYFRDEEYVRVPTKVIDELGKIKDKRNVKYDAVLSDTARTLAREIERSYVRIFNKTNKVRFLIENAALDLLPKELDSTVPDNQILSVAMKYQDWDAYIISDDGVFRLTTMAQNIKPITSEEFIESHRDSFVSLNDRIKAYNSSGTQYQEIADTNRNLDQENKASGKPVDSTTTASINTGSEDDELLIDSLPLNELRKYEPTFGTNELTFLMTNKVKTIGDFRKLTVDRVNGMKAKGKQTVYRNTVISIVRRKDKIIPLIKLP